MLGIRKVLYKYSKNLCLSYVIFKSFIPFFPAYRYSSDDCRSLVVFGDMI